MARLGASPDMIILHYKECCLIYTGISTGAPIGNSIVTVYAADQDSAGGVTYSIHSGNTDNGMEIGSQTGTIYNRVLMADFISNGINEFLPHSNW